MANSAIIETTVSGINYQARPLDPFKQFNIARRLAPVVTGFAEALQRDGTIKGSNPIGELLKGEIHPLVVIGPLMEAISKISDADSDYIFKTCLSNVKREDNGGWAPVLAHTGQLMYPDIDLPVMLQIVWQIISRNLSGFLGALPVQTEAKVNGTGTGAV